MKYAIEAIQHRLLGTKNAVRNLQAHIATEEEAIRKDRAEVERMESVIQELTHALELLS